MVWLVLPCVYGLKQAERSLGDFIASSSSVQTVKAWQSLSRLVEIRGHTTALGQSTIQWERSLRRQIREAESLVAKPLSEDATMRDKLQQAMLLLTLSRTTEAISLLGDVDTLDSQVQLIGAIASREFEDWASVESFCRSIIGAQSKTSGNQDPMPYQLLGESLIHQRKVKEAEKCFREAIVACPHTAGDFEIRLGSLLGESGDHAGAIAHFEAAQKSEPALRSEATRRIASMLNNSCRISSY